MRATSGKSPSPEERAAARRQAVEIARLLDSEAVSYRRITIGEPQCSYRVPFHAEDFWFKVLVSDTEIVFTGEHRRREAFAVPFCAAIKLPWKNMLATTLHSRVSEELGVAVYSPEEITEAAVSASLLTPACSRLLRQLDFAPIHLLFINSIQIMVIAELVSPEHSAKQVRLLRELLLAIYHDAHGNVA